MSGEHAEIQGLEELTRHLGEMGDRITNWTDASARIHEWLIVRQKELFETQGQSEGIRWPVQQPGWAKLKQRMGVKPVPLRWIGGKERLYPSLTKKSHPDHRFRVMSGKIEFGTNVPYAIRHDAGQGENPLGEKIPERKIAVLSDRNQERLAQLLAIYIVRGETNGNQWKK